MDSLLTFQVALTMIPQLGPVKGRKLLESFEPWEIFNLSKTELEKIEGLSNTIKKNILHFNNWKRVREEIEFIERNHIHALFIGTEHYPKRLLHCADAPLLLYKKGDAPLNAERLISVVGTRRNTAYGRIITEKLIASFQDYNITIVSGLAHGIDTIAHQSAIRGKLPTLGVLAHGLDQIYPSANRSLAKKIIKENGALITENRRGIQADKFLFPRRNRIVAGLSDATLVIESDCKGGSLITASLAADYGREVFALPGRVTDRYSSGCLELIKNQRAIPITSAEDIIEWLGWPKPVLNSNNPAIHSHEQKLKTLSADELFLYQLLLRKESLGIEEISQETNWNLTRISSTLLNMELAGLIVSLQTNVFSVS